MFLTEAQIERALLQKLQHLCGFDVLECGTENPEDPADASDGADKREVLLLDRLREAASALSAHLPAAALESALDIFPYAGRTLVTTDCRSADAAALPG
jgi:type I restriction enzyme R subunit